MQKQRIEKQKQNEAFQTQQRKLECATLQINSNQPLTKTQQALSQSPIQLYKNVNIKHITNGVDYAWNHLENIQSKQLDNLYIPTVVQGYQFAYINVKKKIASEQKQKEISKHQRIQQNQDKHKEFQEKKIKNEQIYNKLGLKIAHSSMPITQTTQDPLFIRLSQPKKSFIQESTYDLPDFRGFPIKNLSYIDNCKNPQLINHFINSGMLPKKVFKQTMSKKFQTSEQKLEKLQNTIQIDDMNMENDFDQAYIQEIDEFEKKLANIPQTMYSQVKDRENQLLQNIQGYKLIKKIRNDPQYHVLLGNQIRNTILSKQ